MIPVYKKEAAPCSLNGAAAASFKLQQNYILTQFILQTLADIFTAWQKETSSKYTIKNRCFILWLSFVTKIQFHPAFPGGVFTFRVI